MYPSRVGHAERAKKAAGIRVITAYKLTKGAVQIAGAIALSIFIATGHGHSLHDVATKIRNHATGAWSMALSDFIVSAVEPRHLWILVGALACDGLLSTIEGVALQRGKWWGPWLIVVATSALVPFELVALFHGVHAGRLVALIVNAIIVWYLVRRTLREHRARVIEEREKAMEKEKEEEKEKADDADNTKAEPPDGADKMRA
jgi:uncharacterized membrane protein (DUF2068 family)